MRRESVWRQIYRGTVSNSLRPTPKSYFLFCSYYTRAFAGATPELRSRKGKGGHYGACERASPVLPPGHPLK
jgi:hypothetical protein